MKFASTVFTALLAGSATAFVPARRSFVPSKRAFSSALYANVLKLSDPAKELLDKTDVFIFDCDGVIWRVSSSVLE
jgi:uncharacterized protein YbbC (DUF1343 family)